MLLLYVPIILGDKKKPQMPTRSVGTNEIVQPHNILSYSSSQTEMAESRTP